MASVIESSCEELATAIAQPTGAVEPAEAFAALQRRHEKRVLAFVATRLFRRCDAEDVAQDVWMAVWTKLPTHYEQGNVLSWIFQIASNRCIDHNKKKKPDLFPEGVTPEANAWSESDPTVLAIVQREKMSRLQACIAKLDRRQRCVVVSTLRGHKTGAVAERCGVTPNQVSKAKSTATAALQDCLGSDES